MLVLIPTPIGNLEDITLRALRMLKQADFLLVEDSRKTGLLLKHFGIENKMIPYHKFNEHKSLEQLVEKIAAVNAAGLVTDAGTPGISDPGFLLVRECIRQGIPVECLPGPTAFVPALVNSGFPADRFLFEGFLPVKKGRKTRLEKLAEQEVTIILYESPHRLLRTLQDLAAVLGQDRSVCVSRELTKIYEENVRGSFPEVIAYYSNKTVKGEIVLIVSAE
ncbi:MAG TPA: 16S rRNA (cytidine(1402)-2'-O)-methyltransferase [Bacteroidales bacterium]|nr:16S rRNA (cytidine(1402)-2'-O)-methyltransferase [Bacteroidales bacterium]HSA43135.1 16S rRNA (cytidine(1402)-2'-O)-methyltransferase [Bacteroidales bacterium]